MKNDNTVIIIIAIILALFLFGSFGMIGFGGMGGMMSGFEGGWANGMWIFGMVYMVLAFIAVVLFITWLVRQLQKPRRRK